VQKYLSSPQDPLPDQTVGLPEVAILDEIILNTAEQRSFGCFAS
jgi:hypothetical protein